ncbi:MAG: hypothetical protein PHP64_05595 [Actinomycetota bacterium]|nr:hypothetical protein [Actinomycetota bacterium]
MPEEERNNEEIDSRVKINIDYVQLSARQKKAIDAIIGEIGFSLEEVEKLVVDIQPENSEER